MRSESFSASNVLPEALHERSTRALRDLLETAVASVEAACADFSVHALGGRAFTVASNDAGAAEFLTRCLLPAVVPAGEDPHLRIFICTGSAAPFPGPPRWNLPHTDPRHRERLHLAPDGTVSALYDEARQCWMILDLRTRRALLWIAEADRIPAWESAAPFKQILQWSLVDTPLSLVHGGAVTGARGSMRGALLVGAGGSGKSTTVAACLQEGLRVCGDDLVLIDRSEGAEGWRAHAVYDSMKLLPDAAVPPPASLRDAPWRECGDKRVIRYSDVSPESIARAAPLSALLHCRITGGDVSRLVPIPPSEMLKALGPPTVFLLRGREAHILREVSTLVRALPCMRLELGRDPVEAARLLRRWLDGDAREAPSV